MRTATILPAFVLIASASALSGELPVELMQTARQNAAMHLQLEIVDFTVPYKTPGLCRVTGEIGQIFEDRVGLLEEGKTVELDLACHRADDELPKAPRRWIVVDDLEEASFLEVYMDMAADSRHPRHPKLNYELTKRPVEKATFHPGRRNTHFVVELQDATFEEGDERVDVVGTIRKVFYDKTALLTVDQQVSFSLDCNTSRTVPCRAVTEHLGGYAELAFFLNIPLGQYGVIEYLTEEPFCPRDVEGAWCWEEGEEEAGEEETE